MKDAGKGVYVYVLDTGVRISHSIFRNQAVNFKAQTISPYNNAPMVRTLGILY
jgi:subtilisin family serine protease